MKKKSRSQQAVSEVVGTVLLLGIAISLFGFLNYIVFSFSFGESPPSVSLIATLDKPNNDIIVEHYLGDPLDAATSVIIMVGLSTHEITVRDCLVDKNSDNVWSFGEIVRFHDDTIADQYVQVMVVDPVSNSVILSTILQQGT